MLCNVLFVLCNNVNRSMYTYIPSSEPKSLSTQLTSECPLLISVLQWTAEQHVRRALGSQLDSKEEPENL